MTPLTEKIEQLTKQVLPDIIEFRRQLHMYPELSGKEFKTTEEIHRFLEQRGIGMIPLSIPTGAAAEVKGNGEKTAVIRADIDALPIMEESDLPFRSQIPGVSHMCGHDVHTAIAAGAALVLKELGEAVPGTVRILFQPAEEAEGGAESMIAEGLLDDAEAIIGLHNNPNLPVGTIGVKEGFLMGSIDDFIITVHGKGGHAGVPDQTVDPILIGSAIVSQLQSLVSRTISPMESAAVTVGSFQAGTVNNVIPETAVLKGTVRTSSEELRLTLRDRICRLAASQAEALGGAADIDYQLLIPAVVNHASVTRIMKEAAAETAGADKVTEAKPTMGGDDFAFYLEKIPGCYGWLGSGNEAKGIGHSWHHPKFMVDEDAIEIGIRWMVAAALRLLESDSIEPCLNRAEACNLH